MRVDEQFCRELVSTVVTRRVVEIGRTDDLCFERFVVVFFFFLLNQFRGRSTRLAACGRMTWQWLRETTAST